MKTAVIGSGAWGTALAIRLCKNGHSVVLWSHDARKTGQMCRTRCNPRLPNAALPEAISLSSENACVSGCKLVVMACPSFSMRAVCRGIAPYLDDDAVMACATKGIEDLSLLRMSQVISQETGKTVVVLTGPSHAEEVSQDIPTGCLAACANKDAAELVQDAFMAETFRVYTSPDTIGAEIGGALKNVVALCAGVTDGLGYGDNTKAMLMTRGLTEIARLGVSLGASKDTFAGLAGIGDLIVTCTSLHSRNRRAGILIGQGKSPVDAMQEVGAVVEGYFAAKSAWAVCGKQGVDMPILHAAYAVLYEGESAASVVKTLLRRSKKAESEDAGWI